MYRITKNPKYLNADADQNMYRFFLDEGMVNSSATYKEVMGLVTDIQKGGDFLKELLKYLETK